MVDVDIVGLDQDGDLALVFADREGPQIHLIKGNRFFTIVTDVAMPKRSQGLGVGVEAVDFNGDGKIDWYLVNFRGGDRLYIQE